MPWKAESLMSVRRAFVNAATKEGPSFAALCRHYGISRKTGYKWLARFQAEGDNGLADRSRRPHRSPHHTPPEIEARVLAVRDDHPAWGGRKIRAVLIRDGRRESAAPSVRTMTEILRRHGRLDAEESRKHRPFQRFEREMPNQLWQMDFKGHFAVTEGRCHPWTISDDHSRFLLGLRACADETRGTVTACLTRTFQTFGLPDAMLMDNGAPWGDTGENPYTRLTVWLIRLGIGVLHGRPRHPQTQGKQERLHRTLQAELLSGTTGRTLADWQRRFDDWRRMYNHERPHEALEMAVPASRYAPSERPFPERLSEIRYEAGDAIRKVDQCGRISFKNRPIRIGKAFHGQAVALRPTETEGEWEVYFCHQKVRGFDLNEIERT